MQEKDINTLITDYLWGNVSDEEIRRLRQCFEQSPELKARFGQLTDGRLLAQRYRQYAAVSAPRRARTRVLGVVRRLLPYAAVVAVVAVSTALWLNRNQTAPPVISAQVQQAMEEAKKAGRVVAVVDQKPLPQRPLPQPLPKGEGGDYHPGGNAAEDSTSPLPFGEGSGERLLGLFSAIRITTYQDKEYWQTLPDGTLVHLNYNTRVIYPETFVGPTRDVVLLSGEAYFMVARDRRHPFVVHTQQGDVRVYGTEFNVSTRADDGATEVVLVSGSLGVTPGGGAEQLLQPGQMCSLTGDGCQTTDVDVAPYVAWNEGKFSFQSWPLDKVMGVLAHWYGYEQVSFRPDELRQKRLDGSFSRYDAVDNIMESIATVLSLDIRCNENTIIIQQ